MPENSLIAGDNLYAIGALILGLSFMGFYIDRTPLGRKTSGVVWVITIGLILSNLGVSPLKSPNYDFVFAYLVPLSIPLLLLKTNLRNLVRDGGPILLTFAIASIGTILGAADWIRITRPGATLDPRSPAPTPAAGSVAPSIWFPSPSAVELTRRRVLPLPWPPATRSASLALLTLMAIPSVGRDEAAYSF